MTNTELECLSPFLPQDLLNDINIPDDDGDNDNRSLSSLSSPQPQHSITDSPDDIIHMLTTFTGSHLLQQHLHTMSSPHITHLLRALAPSLPMLMCNSFSSLFLQKLIKLSTHSQRMFILTSIRSSFIAITQHNCGVHCIEALLDKCATQSEYNAIYASIKSHLLDLTLHHNSTHFMQKLLEINVFNVKYLHTFMLSCFCVLCTHLHGATVLRKYIATVNDERTIEAIIAVMESNCVQMCQNQYANYIVQHAIEQFGYAKCKKVIDNVIENIIALSIEKYASNVVDKVVIVLQRYDYIKFQHVLMTVFANAETFVFVNENKYGHFVLVNLLRLVNESDRMVIKACLVNSKLNWSRKVMKIVNCL